MRTVELDDKTADELAAAARAAALGHRLHLLNTEALLVERGAMVEESKRNLQSCRDDLANAIASYEKFANAKLVWSAEEETLVAERLMHIDQHGIQVQFGRSCAAGYAQGSAQNVYPKGNQ